jgi:hypothetical protein
MGGMYAALAPSANPIRRLVAACHSNMDHSIHCTRARPATHMIGAPDRLMVLRVKYDRSVTLSPARLFNIMHPPQHHWWNTLPMYILEMFAVVLIGSITIYRISYLTRRTDIIGAVCCLALLFARLPVWITVLVGIAWVVCCWPPRARS